MVLPQQEALILEVFLHRPREVVSKTEIAQMLWPDDRHRDFDRSIHNLVSKLRRLHPDAASWFETVRKTGYRFCLPVVEELSPAFGSTIRVPAIVLTAQEPDPPLATEEYVAPALPAIPAPEAGHRPFWAWPLATGLALLALVFLILRKPAVPPEATHRSPMTIGILPLSSRPADQATAETLRGMLSDTLAALPNLEVRAEHSLPQVADVSHTQLQNTARDLKLDMFLGGSLVLSASGYTLNLELIRGTDGAHIRSLHYQGPAATLGAIPVHVAEDLAPELLTAVSEQGPQHMLGGTTSAPAYELAFQAHALLVQRTRESVTEASALYLKATEADPHFAAAWSGLAESHLVLANFGGGTGIQSHFDQARKAAVEALALQPSNPEAHSTLGLVLLQHDWNLRDAERELRLAVSTAPGSAVHHLHLALLLTDEGHFNEAVQQIGEAEEVDPAWPVVHGTAMYVYIAARKYPIAQREASILVAMRPEWGRAHRHLGWALWYAGKHTAAVKEWIEADILDNRMAGAESEKEGLNILSQKGVHAYAEHKVAAQKKTECADDDFIAAEWLAFAGARTETLAALESMVAQKDPESLKIPTNPAYDFLVGDDRFRGILARLAFIDVPRPTIAAGS